MALDVERIGGLFKNSEEDNEGITAKRKDTIGYISIPGTNFLPYDETSQYLRYDGILDIRSDSQYSAEVNLPDGAIITKVIVFGSGLGAYNWDFIEYRLGEAGGTYIAANQAFDAEFDATQDEQWIADNQTKTYLFQTNYITFAGTMLLQGARVEYIIK